MTKVLHIMTKGDDSTAIIVIEKQRENTQLEVRTVKLDAASPDYAAVIRQIFEADRVIVW